MNRSVHGDIVVVEVFPESEWKAPAEEVVDQEGILSRALCIFLFISVNA